MQWGESEEPPGALLCAAASRLDRGWRGQAEAASACWWYLENRPGFFQDLNFRVLRVQRKPLVPGFAGFGTHCVCSATLR